MREKLLTALRDLRSGKWKDGIDPRIDLKKEYITKWHWGVESVSYVLLLSCFLYVLGLMKTVEGEFPIHFDLQGNVDGYGSVKTMLIIPVIMLLVNLLISVCIHLVPAKKWNMPFPIRRPNAVRCYKTMTWVLVLIEAEISLWSLLTAVAWGTEQATAVFPLSMLLTAALFITFIVGMVIMAFQNKG